MLNGTSLARGSLPHAGEGVLKVRVSMPKSWGVGRGSRVARPTELFGCSLLAVMPMPALFQPHPHAELPGKHCRRRKARTVFSDSQLSGLEKRFEIQRYLSTPERVELATALSLSETQVRPGREATPELPAPKPRRKARPSTFLQAPQDPPPRNQRGPLRCVGQLSC